ncbi:TonB C-terminal domain-containing protein [Chromobacterium vaccinii]|uniref:energy transducer TonB n=1 Tax=Chromobacterium vaccinii TaxID=1108595 RepID=UPI001E534127|nr:energy transducer TonB [Chromobacterium vaccinii]MCD4485887.1 TonB C-terminal domain-containing protein [Chromobacterium vaccinii]
MSLNKVIPSLRILLGSILIATLAACSAGFQTNTGLQPNAVHDNRAENRAAWIRQVQAQVTPLVQIPHGMMGNPEVRLRVRLLPTMEVASIQMIQSSGTPAYDDAACHAVWEAKNFPPLPVGANFNDGYRVFTMTFHPR